MESHLSQQQSWLQSLVQYGMGAAQLWKDHSSALVEDQRVRRESLERLRAQHDTQNQNMEANLDLVLDRMRQGSTEEVRGREGGRERLREMCISSGAGAVPARGCEAAGSYFCRVSEGRRKWLVARVSPHHTHTHTPQLWGVPPNSAGGGVFLASCSAETACHVRDLPLPVFWGGQSRALSQGQPTAQSIIAVSLPSPSLTGALSPPHNVCAAAEKGRSSSHSGSQE